MFLWKVAGRKYPSRHAVAYFRRWEDMSFLDFLQQHVHDYYINKSMQQIHGHNIFPVVQDQIRYGGETNPDAATWTTQPKTNPQSLLFFSILMNPQLSALSVEREDIIKRHAQMMWHDPSLSYCRCFCCSSLFSFFLELWWIVNCTSIW